MWWWFKKRKDKSSDDKRWASLAASLKLSFSQVKEDIDHLTSSDSSQNQKLDDVSRRMQLVESRLDSLYLLNVTRNHHLQQEIPERKETKQQTNPETTLHLIENLTDVQRAILMTLAQVTHEVPSHQISLRDLSLELYPNKRYNDVRTMMSEYTDKLLEFGLINKKRKGREVVISLTDKTQQMQATPPPVPRPHIIQAQHKPLQEHKEPHTEHHTTQPPTSHQTHPSQKEHKAINKKQKEHKEHNKETHEHQKEHHKKD